jgi:REP element-mobilizing transposase RayT
MPSFITEYPQFFTASIKGWYKLLEHEKYKDIIINSLRFLVEDKRIKLYAFAIMSDHIHLVLGWSSPLPDRRGNLFRAITEKSGIYI